MTLVNDHGDRQKYHNNILHSHMLLVISVLHVCTECYANVVHTIRIRCMSGILIAALSSVSYLEEKVL